MDFNRIDNLKIALVLSLAALFLGLLGVSLFKDAESPSYAGPALTAFQGGTGTSSPSGILYGDESIRLNTVVIGSGLSFAAGTLSASGGSSVQTVSTSTTPSIGNLAYWTTSGATPELLGTVATSSVTISSPLTSGGTAGYVVGGSSWAIGLDTSGSWTGNAGTATALAADPTDCSAGSFPLGINAAGTAQSCTDAWTEAENTSAGYGTGSVTSIATTYPVTGGTITTTGTIGIAFGTTTANSWSALNTFDTSTSTLFSATTAWIDTLNLTNDLTVANGGTGASTLTGLLQGNGTSAFTAITDSSTDGQVLRVTGASTYAWGALNLADGDAVTGVLPHSNGGTATSSSYVAGMTNWLVTGLAADLRTAVSGTTGTGSLVFATSPSFTTPALGTIASGVGTALTALDGEQIQDDTIDDDSIDWADITIADLTGTQTSGAITWDLSAATVKQHTDAAFGYATSTTWTGTTTRQLGPAFYAEDWDSVKCFTDVGTVWVSIGDGTNQMDNIQASTTVGTNTLTTNTTFTASEKRYVSIGTPASSPTEVSCTVDKIVN